MRAQRALLLAFAALVARTEAECPGKHDRDYDPNCIEDNMEPRIPMNAQGNMLDGSHEQVACYVRRCGVARYPPGCAPPLARDERRPPTRRYPPIMRDFCHGSVESCDDVKIIQHWCATSSARPPPPLRPRAPARPPARPPAAPHRHRSCDRVPGRNGHERYTTKQWGCANPPNPPPPPPSRRRRR